MADMLDMRRELYGELIGMPATPPRAIVPKYVGTTITDCQRYCPSFEIYYDWFCGSERRDDYYWNSGTFLCLALLTVLLLLLFSVHDLILFAIVVVLVLVLVAVFVVVIIVIVATRLGHIAM